MTEASSARVSGALRVGRLLHGRQSLVQCQPLEQGFPLFGVVAIARRELAQETDRRHDSQLPVQDLDRLLGDFGQGFCLDIHGPTCSSVRTKSFAWAKTSNE